MKADCIHFKDTGYFSKIILDYLEGNKKLTPFFEYSPEIKSFGEAISKKIFSSKQRTILVHSLKEQYQKGNINLKKFDKLRSNIDLLQKDKTYTVTTGHQLCLFTGPLYFVYKIISTIRLADSLNNQYPDQHFIPIYWMATEDHDFAEINHFRFKEQKLEWKTDQTGAVGRMSTEGLKTIHEEFSKLLVDYSGHAEELKTLFQGAYLKHNNLAAASRYLVNKLFADYGLVIIDGDDPSLKREFAQIVKEELKDEISSNLVEKQSKELSKHYKVQVNPREINLFYLKDELRERILREDGNYTVNNTSITFSENEIMEELEKYPERFSPNVLLRPLYQETILPNLAYIGGGGELAYWFQLKSTFDHFQTPLPVLLLRNSALWMDQKQTKYFKSLQISFDQLFQEYGVLLKNWVKQHAKEDLTLEQEIAQFKRQYNALTTKAGRIDASLVPHVQALFAKQQKSIQQLSEKLIRAERRKQSEVEDKIEFLKSTLFPNGGLQERTDNFSSIFISEGYQMLEIIEKRFDTFPDEFTIIKV